MDDYLGSMAPHIAAMEGGIGGLDALLPPWLQAVITVFAAALIFGAGVWGKIKGDPSPAVHAVSNSRQEFMEMISVQTSANRDVLMSNRELLATIRDNTSRSVAVNEEILRLLRRQVSDHRDGELTDRVVAKVIEALRPHQHPMPE